MFASMDLVGFTNVSHRYSQEDGQFWIRVLSGSTDENVTRTSVGTIDSQQRHF